MQQQTPPESITLPKSGGVVWFRDIEELDGVAYHQIRDLSVDVRGGRKPISDLMKLAATLLVTRWDIPGLPNLPLPGDPGGNSGEIIGMLNWRDTRWLEENLLPACSTLAADTEKDPTTPPPSD